MPVMVVVLLVVFAPAAVVYLRSNKQYAYKTNHCNSLRKYFWMRYYASEFNIPRVAPIPSEIAIPIPIVTGLGFCIMRFLIFKVIVDFISEIHR
jgi:hypothetical protein